MSGGTLEALVPALAIAGLIIGATAYHLLIRRRNRERLESEELARARSAGRTRSRFRRLQRHDKP